MINRSLTIIILCMVFFTQSAICKKGSNKGSKNYHLIYIDISRCQDRQNFTYSLTKLLDSILLRQDDFLLYLSNGYQPEIVSSERYQKQQKDNLISLMQTLNTSPPVVRFDKDSIFRLWDIQNIKDVTPDNKTILLYKNICFHYFVSSDFFKLEEIEIVDRFLLVMDLTKIHIEPGNITIHAHFSKKDSEVFIEREAELEKYNFTDYNYIFSSY
jgi:hypothetical protein